MLTEENIKVLISVAYRAGWRDGRDGKDLPTKGELDGMVDTMYITATMAKQEADVEEANEEAEA